MAKLVFQNGPYAGKSVSLLEGKSITLGRNRDIELPLPDLKLSRRHCQITLRSGKGLVCDLGSTNGTFLNGTRISTNEVELNDFDRVVLGDTEIEYHGEMENLPKNFDASAQDPFGMNDDDDILPENVPAVPPVPKAAARVPQVPPVAVPPSPAAAKGMNLEFDVDLDVGPVAPAASARPTPIAQPAPPTVRAMPAPAVAVAAPAAPVEIQLDVDPLEEALADLRRPLPPEPPGSQSTAPAVVKSKPQVRFCDVCSGSIPVLDWDLGQAKELNGHNFCKDCLASGAQVPAGTTRTMPPSGPGPAPASAPKRSLDDIMAGLEEEAVIVDTSVKRRGASMDEEETERKIGQIQKLQETTAVRPNLQRAPVQKPPQKADTVKEGLGDEFEEIG